MDINLGKGLSIKIREASAHYYRELSFIRCDIEVHLDNHLVLRDKVGELDEDLHFEEILYFGNTVRINLKKSISFDVEDINDMVEKSENYYKYIKEKFNAVGLYDLEMTCYFDFLCIVPELIDELQKDIS